MLHISSRNNMRLDFHQTFRNSNILTTLLKSLVTGLFGVLLQIHLGVYHSGSYPIGFFSCAGSINMCSFTTRSISTIDSLTSNSTMNFQLSSQNQALLSKINHDNLILSTWLIVVQSPAEFQFSYLS